MEDIKITFKPDHYNFTVGGLGNKDSSYITGLRTRGLDSKYKSVALINDYNHKTLSPIQGLELLSIEIHKEIKRLIEQEKGK